MTLSGGGSDDSLKEITLEYDLATRTLSVVSSSSDILGTAGDDVASVIHLTIPDDPDHYTPSYNKDYKGEGGYNVSSYELKLIFDVKELKANTHEYYPHAVSLLYDSTNLKYTTMKWVGTETTTTEGEGDDARTVTTTTWTPTTDPIPKAVMSNTLHNILPVQLKVIYHSIQTVEGVEVDTKTKYYSINSLKLKVLPAIDDPDED